MRACVSDTRAGRRSPADRSPLSSSVAPCKAHHDRGDFIERHHIIDRARFTLSAVRRPRISAGRLSRLGSMCWTIAIGSANSAGSCASTLPSAVRPPADAARTTMRKLDERVAIEPCCCGRARRGDIRSELTPPGCFFSHELCSKCRLVAQHDLIVVGASSGGVEALTTLVAGLPSSLAAAVFIVLHVRPEGPSFLPAVLNRAGQLPVAHAVDGEPIRRGRVYVAPPAHQTYLQRGRIAVRQGPQENLHRPAVDPLFRTAAHHYGPRVVGIVLSGVLDDGSAGLLAVRHAGGVTIVQDPSEALFGDMPANAFEAVGPDYCVPVADVAN